MDVLLIDDKDGEGALLHREWDGQGVRTFQVTTLDDLLAIAHGRIPSGWGPPAPAFDLVIIDLDLGHESSGAAGGLQAISAVNEWQHREGGTFHIVLRTQDVDDDRSLSAVLAAELLGGPLPLWGKRTEDARNLLAFVLASRSRTANPTEFGGVLIHPVRIIKDERSERLLGEYLFEGHRGQVWTFLFDGYDADVAVLYAGYKKRNKFWEQVNDLFSAIVHLRDLDSQLHQLGGQPIRLTDIELAIAEDELQEVEIAIAAISSGIQRVPEKSKGLILRLLEHRRVELDDWIKGARKTKPSFNRNFDQGEFLGVFGRVLGHPDILELFHRDAGKPIGRGRSPDATRERA